MTPSKGKNVLKSSCGLILFFMRLIGIPLNLHSSRNQSSQNLSGKLSIFHRLIANGFSFFMFFVNMENNLIVVILTIIYTVDKKSEGTLLFSTTYLWNEVIDVLNYVFVTFGVHLVLLTTTLFRWPNFVRVAHQLDHEFQLSLEEHKCFRRISITYFFCLIIVICIIVIF